jgi:lysophospholipase L1-like esterase
MHNRDRRERGQSTVEWAGSVGLIAAIVVALIAIGLPGQVSAAVSCGVTKAFGHSAASCTSGGGTQRGPAGGDPNAPWNSTDPVARATWGGYVSLGDSYSAGEGLGDYQHGSHVEQSQCLIHATPLGGPCIYHKDPKVIDGCDRSGGAYNGTVTGRYRFNGGKTTHACSGATTKNVYDGPGDQKCTGGAHSGDYGEGCQADNVNKHTSLVTLSIGGNDIGFSDDLVGCYKHDFAKVAGRGLHLPIGTGSCSFESSTIDGKIAALKQTIVPMLQRLRALGPHARIIVMTYPRLFPEPPTKNSGCIGPHLCLTPVDQEFFNQEADKLDAGICSDVQAAAVGGECINAANAFDSCEVGQSDSCLQSPSLHISGSTGIKSNPGAFHPTQRGQQLLGQLINQEIGHPPA